MTAIAGFGVLVLADIRMLRDFGLVTLIDLSVSLLGVLVALPAALMFAERRTEGRSVSQAEFGTGVGARVDAGVGHER